MTTFFSSDLHLNHARIIELCPKTRPYKDVKEMNEHLIDSWNSVVRNSDIVYFLGDFAFKSDDEQLTAFFKALRGQKHLIEGNHDHTPTRKLPWQEVRQGKTIRFGDQNVEICHYPIVAGQWKNAHHGAIHLFGHVHGEPQYWVPVKAFDVGVDAIGPVPISYEQIQEKADKIPLVVKHHKDDPEGKR